MKQDGLGLEIMRHRAGMIGAGLEIEAGPRGGTRVTCSLQALTRDPTDAQRKRGERRAED
jgi:nitrate/nitrite-specific signal transduction histidine kinase